MLKFLDRVRGLPQHEYVSIAMRQCVDDYIRQRDRDNWYGRLAQLLQTCHAHVSRPGDRGLAALISPAETGVVNVDACLALWRLHWHSKVWGGMYTTHLRDADSDGMHTTADIPLPVC